MKKKKSVRKAAKKHVHGPDCDHDHEHVTGEQVTPEALHGCVVVCAQVLGPEGEGLLSETEDALLIAVDGGLNHVRKAGVLPSLWIGDGDSVNKTTLKAAKSKGVHAIGLPESKDYSDLEFALHVAGQAYLEGTWQGDLVVLGAQTGRFDHDLCNIFTLARWVEEIATVMEPENCPNVMSVGPHGLVAGTTHAFEFITEKNTVFSVLTSNPDTKITIHGAKYNVKNRTFDHASTGLSNVSLGKVIKVSVAPNSKGTALIVIPKQ